MAGRVRTSVIIVTHDSAGDIAACLEPLRGELGPAGAEVVVVDNGSRDGTAALVRRRFPFARVVEQENLGFGAGNNRGVREARGDVLLFLNPDTAPEPGFVAALAAAVAPGQAATAQVLLKSDPGRINTAGHRLHFTGYGFIVAYGRPRMPAGPPIPAQGLSGAAFAMRRDDYDRLGGFDEDFFLYMEDTELSWRANRAGMRLVVAPAAACTHDYVPGLASLKVEHLETGRALLLRKHLPWFLWLAYAPSLLLAEALAWARAAYLGAPGLRAKWHGVRRGWRRGIRRYPGLPRARPHAFASRAIPFRAVSGWRTVALLGGLVNLLFHLNTLLWPLRRGRPRPRLDG